MALHEVKLCLLGVSATDSNLGITVGRFLSELAVASQLIPSCSLYLLTGKWSREDLYSEQVCIRHLLRAREPDSGVSTGLRLKC